MNRFALLGLLCGTMAVIGLSSGGSGQPQATAAAPRATKYFLDAPPSQDDLAHLPPDARDVIVAKIRIIYQPHWIGGWEQLPPSPHKFNLMTRIELMDVLRGTGKTGEQIDAFFLAPGEGRAMTPVTPAEEARPYFVMIFFNAKDEQQLLGLPPTQDEFDKWEAEWGACQRLLSHPGVHSCSELSPDGTK